jgi:hypothetical protein
MYEFVMSNSETGHSFVKKRGTEAECLAMKAECENLIAYTLAFDTFTVREVSE